MSSDEEESENNNKHIINRTQNVIDSDQFDMIESSEHEDTSAYEESPSFIYSDIFRVTSYVVDSKFDPFKWSKEHQAIVDHCDEIFDVKQLCYEQMKDKD